MKQTMNLCADLLGRLESVILTAVVSCKPYLEVRINYYVYLCAKIKEEAKYKDGFREAPTGDLPNKVIFPDDPTHVAETPFQGLP